MPFLQEDHYVKGLFVREAAPKGTSSIRTPILMVHGVSHGWWVYEKWLPFFAVSGWHAYALSLRNHTGSYAVPKETYLRMTLADYVEDVRSVLEWLDRPCVLVGHSMGGLIVQKAAERETPRAVVLVASVGPGQLGSMRDPLPADRPLLFDEQEARRLWFHHIDEKTFASVYSRIVPESPSVMNDYSGGRIHVDQEAIGCPVLAVGAEHDRTVVHDFRAIAEFYGCESLFVPGAGHDLMLEPGASDVAIRINQWLLTRLADQGLTIEAAPRIPT